jgi:hypothetical protein
MIVFFFYNKSCRLKNLFNGVMVIKQKTTTGKILTEMLNSPSTSKLPLPMCKNPIEQSTQHYDYRSRLLINLFSFTK